MAAGEYARFRAWLSTKLRKRGVATRLALALDKERNWAGRVAKGSTDVPFSGALAIAEYFNTSLGNVLRPDMPPGFEAIALPADLADAMRDPVIVAAVEALQRVDAAFRLQTAQGLRMVARLPLIVPSAVSNGGTTTAARTKTGPGKRR
jgi:hypothetical protein